MRLVKLTIKDQGHYYIGEEIAAKLLSSDLSKPMAINGLIKFAGDLKQEHDAVYKRLAIFEHTEFTLERAKTEDVETIK